MAIRSRVYYWLECTNRIDNIVAGECGTRSPGDWGDQDAMEQVALERGWVKTGRGHSCPTCAAATATAAAEPAPAKPTRPGRKSKAETSAEPAESFGGHFDGNAA